VAFEGMQNFLNAFQNYAILKGTQSNLYKCFLPQSWMIGSAQGISGFLHPEGVYDDLNGGPFRLEIYPRLKYHFQFQNELSLFGDVDHHVKFSINIYSAQLMEQIQFFHVANLFSVATVDACFQYTGSTIVSGIKDDKNDWNLTGHLDRIILVDYATLELFSKLYDEKSVPARQARLPVVHSRQIVEVLRKFATQQKRLGDLEGEYFSTEMWHEVNAQKDGTIKRATQFVDSSEQWILSGPHFYVGNPLNKTPRSVNRLSSDYDPIDLTVSSDNYIPRTNYIPACEKETYRNRIPKVPWGDRPKITDYYRLVYRAMLPPTNERTLIGAIFPKGLGHINLCRSFAFSNDRLLDVLVFAAFTFSIPFDFLIKTTGRPILHQTLNTFPLIISGNFTDQLQWRALLLNCLTTHYAELWEECWDEAFKKECWTKDDHRLDNAKFANLTPKWQRNCALRTDYERRQALVEIDVLAAMALGLTLDELCTIYRIQFPVLRQNENDTWYDQSGRIVFTVSKGLPGVGYSRPEWNEIKDMKTGTVSRTITDDTLPGGPIERTITYTAPFDRCNREADYTTACTAFEQRGLK
jgi:hypothetical protein